MKWSWFKYHLDPCFGANKKKVCYSNLISLLIWFVSVYFSQFWLSDYDAIETVKFFRCAAIMKCTKQLSSLHLSILDRCSSYWSQNLPCTSIVEFPLVPVVIFSFWLIFMYNSATSVWGSALCYKGNSIYIFCTSASQCYELCFAFKLL